MGSKRASYFWKTFPMFLVVSMGLSLHNAIAVIEGLFGIKTPFHRTPKFNVFSSNDSWKDNQYLNLKLSPVTMMEGLLTIYFLFGIYAGIKLDDLGLVIFHIMLAAGFGTVFFQSVNSLRNA